ncbi:radical SAM protein [Marinilongibacter aquaticus]|uniref:radical SAM protein n=1 Tax=Marinilongibacter aquaticus TaxID=2975157 RepID=UPI0021BDE97F|nr:radical SAM protein [Marinilongibacter aquaticus]UBM59300.1 radical SAM protein [Marinilongibacter aquaticus]
MINKVARKVNKKYLPQKYFFNPEGIVLGVNNACNLHCKMCDVGTKNKETNFSQNLIGARPLHMPLELIKKIIDQSAFYFPKVKLGYAFTEPLIYKYLEESLWYSKRKGIETNITTNALTLKQHAKTIVDAGVEELFVSLDGIEDVHNRIRGNNRSFQRALEGLDEIFVLDKTKKVSIFCVITEWNIETMFDFVEYFKDFPLKQIGFMHPNFTSQYTADYHNAIWGNLYPATASNVFETNLQDYDKNRLWDEILKIQNKKYPFRVSFSPHLESKEKLFEYYEKPGVLIGRGCNDIFRNIMIKADGNVIPAHGRCFNLTIGNIYEQNLKRIWNSKVLSDLRKNLSNSGGLFPACSRCCSAF